MEMKKKEYAYFGSLLSVFHIYWFFSKSLISILFCLLFLILNSMSYYFLAMFVSFVQLPMKTSFLNVYFSNVLLISFYCHTLQFQNSWISALRLRWCFLPLDVCVKVYLCLMVVILLRGFLGLSLPFFLLSFPPSPSFLLHFSFPINYVSRASLKPNNFTLSKKFILRKNIKVYTKE